MRGLPFLVESSTLIYPQVQASLGIEHAICFCMLWVEVISIMILTKVSWFVLCSRQPSTPKAGANKEDGKKSGSKTPQQVRHSDNIRNAL